jgi:hypothetical protein
MVRLMYILATPTVLALKQSHQLANRVCKPVPGSPEWPSVNEWERLGQDIENRLLKIPPLGAVCHVDQPSYNNEACSQLQQRWTDPGYRSYIPVSLMGGNGDEYCLPDAQAPCYAEAFPAYVINATTTHHVKRGIQFG